MAFKFKLTKILKMREDAVQELIGEIKLIEKDIEKTKLDIKVKYAEIKSTQDEMMETNYQYAEGHLRILKKLEKEFEKLHEKLAKLREKLKSKQEELFEMRMKVETLKKLRERQSEEYYREENRKEQLETDEKVALKFASDMVKAQQEADEDVWS
jgi:flagellar export protein FliJ